MVMLHIKFNGITNAATRYKYFASYLYTWGGVKRQLIQNIVMLHIKLKRIEDPTPTPNHDPRFWGLPAHGHVAYQFKWNHECSNKYFARRPSLHRLWGLGQKATFLEHGHVANKNKGNQRPHRPTLSPSTILGNKRLKFNCFRTWRTHIKLKGITNAATW